MAQAIAEESRMELGRQVFSQQAQPSCSICHSLVAAGAVGNIGPNLDQLKPRADRVAAAVTNGVGVMPAYGSLLSAEEIEAVAYFVSEVAGRSE